MPRPAVFPGRRPKQRYPAGDHGTAVVFAAGSTTLTWPGHPVLVVDLTASKPPFRCIPAQLRAAEDNLG